MQTTRRGFIAATAAFAPLALRRAGASEPLALWSAKASEPLALRRAPASGAAGAVKNGRLKQSVSRWPYAKIPLPEFCRACAEMGLTAVDLLEENEWPVAREHGLICSMGYAGGGSIKDGLNVKANHDAIVRNFTETIPRAAKMKVANVITFFGNKRGMS